MRGPYARNLELRLPRVAKRITGLRIEAVRRDHFCSTFQPHIYGGFILNGASLWPAFELRNRSGAAVVPQYQRDQPYSGQKYGGYLDPGSGEVVGAHRAIGSKGCFLATLAMALSFAGVPITVPALQANMQANRGFVAERVCRIVSVGGQNPADTVIIAGLPRASEFVVPAWAEFVVNRTSDPYGGALARLLVLDSTRAIVMAHPDTAPPIAEDQRGFVYRLVDPDKAAKLITGTSSTRLGFERRISDPSLPMAVESALLDSLPSLLYVGINDTIPHWVLTTGWGPAFVSGDSARGTYGVADPAQTTGPSTLLALHGNHYKGAWVARLVPSGRPQTAPGAAGAGSPATLELVHTGFGHVQLTGPSGASLSYDMQADAYVTNIPGLVAVRHAHPGDPMNASDPDVPSDMFIVPVEGAASYTVTSTGAYRGTVALTASYRPGAGPDYATGESATLEQGGRGIFSLTVNPALPEPVALTLVTTVGLRPEFSRPTLNMHISPNPSIGLSRIDYVLPTPGRQQLQVLDVAGRRIRMLRSGHGAPGAHTEFWDGKDDHGAPTRAGLYFVRLQAGQDAVVARCLRLDSGRR